MKRCELSKVIHFILKLLRKNQKLKIEKLLGAAMKAIPFGPDASHARHNTPS